MDKNKNYYGILGIDKSSDKKIIKKAYYKLSMKHHPDKGGDTEIFDELAKAYDILMDDDTRIEYDQKSKFGQNYNEYFELLDVDFDFSYESGKEKLDNFKKNEINNIVIEVGENFNGSVEYERWVKCKTCDGSGKDLSSKIVIRDNDGNIIKTFDSDDGCDFCEGSGKDYRGKDCSFCAGLGKVGLNSCDSCKGNGRILGKQKLKGLKLTGDETKFDTMGHYSKKGVGYLVIVKTI